MGLCHLLLSSCSLRHLLATCVLRKWLGTQPWPPVSSSLLNAWNQFKGTASSIHIQCLPSHWRSHNFVFKLGPKNGFQFSLFFCVGSLGPVMCGLPGRSYYLAFDRHASPQAGGGPGLGKECFLCLCVLEYSQLQRTPWGGVQCLSHCIGGN